MMESEPDQQIKSFRSLGSEVTKGDKQIETLQEQLAKERDARLEERFVFIVLLVLLLDVVFFSTMHNFGGPLSLVVLELLVLIPLARRMGMEEIAAIINRVIDSVASNSSKKE